MEPDFTALSCHTNVGTSNVGNITVSVLAVGYRSGRLLLCSVENADVLHSVVLKSSITCMQWVEINKPDNIQDKKTAGNTKEREWDLFADGSDTFLSKLPPLNKL